MRFIPKTPEQIKIYDDLRKHGLNYATAAMRAVCCTQNNPGPKKPKPKDKP
jgi:hypothetical protein